jgi:hypothetical protein
MNYVSSQITYIELILLQIHISNYFFFNFEIEF